MEQASLDIIKIMLESQTKQLDEIRAALIRIDQRLDNLDIQQTKTTGIIQTCFGVVKSWQFWAILVGAYATKDLSQLKNLLAVIAGK